MLRLSLLLTLLFFPALSQARSAEIGVLIMAHGGSPSWNDTVIDTVNKAELPYPARVFFGMAHTKKEVDRLQRDVRALESEGVHTIIVVPLLVSSYSEIYRQWRYLLGVDFQPGFNTSFFPIKKRADIQFNEPFNDDPLVGLIMLDRVREISTAPEQETVLLVAHGPNDNFDNIKWLRMLQRICVMIRTRGKFKNVEGVTLRDDATPEVRGQAVNALRGRVEALEREGSRVLVIPLLIAPGGIENKIGVALKGLDYTLNAKVLLPDPRISQWIRSKVPN